MYRFGLVASDDFIEGHFMMSVQMPVGKYFNVSHGNIFPVIVDYPNPHLRLMRWGLIPSTWKEKGPPENTHLIGDRGLIKHPMFRKPIRKSRCIIPCSYYIVKHEAKNYLVYVQGAKVFGVAGVWDAWKLPNEPKKVVHSFSIILTQSNTRLKYFGEQMPMILKHGGEYRMWLKQDTPLNHITSVLGPYPGKMNAVRITDKVADPDFQNDQIIKPLSKPVFKMTKQVPVKYEETRRGKRVVEWETVYYNSQDIREGHFTTGRKNEGFTDPRN